MDKYELAWAAGFFDGEGNIGINAKYSGVKFHQHMQMSVCNTHKPHLPRFKLAVLNLGIVEQQKVPLGNKPKWVWRIQDFEGIQAVISILWFKLGDEKRTASEEALLSMREYFKTITTYRKVRAHGTVSKHRWGCRCELCIEASRKYARELYYKKTNRPGY